MVRTELPTSRVSDPADAPPLNWGILGGGWIAGRFVDAATRFGNQQVVAIGSRDAERARGFAAEHGIPHRHGSYEDLVADPDVDVVYVSSPHTHHLPHARLALEAGKHVLVEKPIGSTCCGNCSTPVHWAHRRPCCPTTASGSRPPTGSHRRTWPAVACSIWARTTSR